MITIEELLESRKASTADLVTLYDQLEPVSTDFMMGRWKGIEIASGHPMDGLLELSGWYGKKFIDLDQVHPLVMFGNSPQSFWSLSPKLIPLHRKFPKTKLISIGMKLLKPFLKTEAPKARIRMMEHRDKVTATMIYDDKAIFDHFAKIDDHTVLGCMDMKGVDLPYFWVMQRDDQHGHLSSLT